MSQSGLSDLGFMCGVVCYLRHVLSHLQFGLNNIRVIDLTLLHSSRLSLTVAGMNLLVEDYLSLLSSISVLQLFMVSEFVPNGSIKIIRGGSVMFSLVFNVELSW